MKKIQISQIDGNEFSKYGYLCDLVKPEGEKISNSTSIFYRDMLQLGYYRNASVSACQLFSRPMYISGAECHSHCGEVILALDGDIIIPVAPALPDGQSPVGLFEAFYIKKGTMVYLKQGVWHGAAFPVNNDCVNLLIILPERTYANDCQLLDFSEENRISIEANE